MDSDTEARIRQRAFELWEADGRPYGRSAYYWLLAEEDVLQRPIPTNGFGHERPASAERRPALPAEADVEP